jgi:hypothetical protein
MSRRATGGDDEGVVKITNQFWRHASMVYDLSCNGTRITIAMAPHANDDGMGAWAADVSAKRLSAETTPTAEPRDPRRASEPYTHAARGATRGEALRAVAALWSSRETELGLPTLDWERITQALAAVRALG